MDYFIPTHMSGRAEADGLPYKFFRGIHHVREALANSHQANALGIVPVEEMSDENWRLLGLDKDAWMEANRPQPEKVGDGETAREAAEQPAEADGPPVAS